MNAIAQHAANPTRQDTTECAMSHSLALSQHVTRSAGEAFGGSNLSQCGSHAWFVIRVVHQMRGIKRGELIARDEVSAKGFRTYLPLMAEWKKARDKRLPNVEAIKPLFPGYLFVCFDAADRDWGNVYTPAVKYVFCSTPGNPTAVPTAIIEALMDKGRPGDGVIDDRYTGPEFPRIEVQTPVRITSGPFADVHGICKMSSATRVTMLHDLLGEVSVPRRLVEIV